MTEYRRLYLGQKHSLVRDCLDGGFVGVDFGIREDLTYQLPDNFKDFNRKYVPVYMELHPDKSKVVAGLACGNLWVVAKDMAPGDIIVAPDTDGTYHVAEVVGPYYYAPDGPLPHRRRVEWRPETFTRSEMSDSLRGSSGTPPTHVNLTQHAVEIDQLISGTAQPNIVAEDPTIEDPSVFALEKHLEDFLVANWDNTPLGRTHRVFEDSGEVVGQQYPSDTGPIDILAISHDGTELLVVELKRGRASDTVVGQIQRYMGFVQGELAEPHQSVRGAIIALDDDTKIQRALSVAPNIDFYRYEVKFDLHKAN